MASDADKILVECTACGAKGKVTPARLARNVACPKCQAKNPFRRVVAAGRADVATDACDPVSVPNETATPAELAPVALHSTAKTAAAGRTPSSPRPRDTGTELADALESAPSQRTGTAVCEAVAAPGTLLSLSDIDEADPLPTPLPPVGILAGMDTSDCEALPDPLPHAPTADLQTAIVLGDEAPARPQRPDDIETAILKGVPELAPVCAVPPLARDRITGIHADIMACIRENEPILMAEHAPIQARNAAMGVAALVILGVSTPVMLMMSNAQLPLVATGAGALLMIALAGIHAAWKNACTVITARRVFVRKGLVRVSRRIVPVEQIRTLHLTTGLIDRMAGTQTLGIETTDARKRSLFDQIPGLRRDITMAHLTDYRLAMRALHQ